MVGEYAAYVVEYRDANGRTMTAFCQGLDEKDALQNFFEFTAGVAKDDILEVRHAYTVSYAIGDELASDSIVATTEEEALKKFLAARPTVKPESVVAIARWRQML